MADRGEIPVVTGKGGALANSCEASDPTALTDSINALCAGPGGGGGTENSGG